MLSAYAITETTERQDETRASIDPLRLVSSQLLIAVITATKEQFVNLGR
jgi:hypothetical protein